MEARTKCPSFCQQLFQLHFLMKKCMISNWYLTEVCSKGTIYQYSSIGSDNGLVQSKQQAIIWTNDGLFTDVYMRHVASMS